MSGRGRVVTGRVMAPALVAAAVIPAGLHAQFVNFDADMPRVMVFLQEEGVTASTILTRFLADAGFEVVDPAFARTAAQRERAARALAGDEGEAVELGRDLGAQIIVIGSAPADAAPNPAERTLMVGTAEIHVRALRLDHPRIVATASTAGRAPDATPAGARSAALRRAADELLYGSGFLGSVLIDWEERRWDNRAYWAPEPGSVLGQLGGLREQPGAGRPAPVRPAGAAAEAGGLGLAIIDSEIFPDRAAGTRGIGVAARPQGAPPGSVVRARVRGLVTGGADAVTVGRDQARLRSLTPEEATRFGVAPGDRDARLFEAEVTMQARQDTLRVAAVGRDGARTSSLVRPGIGKRWAVIIGIDEYRDRRIAPLDYAVADARAIHDFLRSEAGGAVPESQIRLLLNQDATFENLRDALFVFLQQAAPEDMVLIYLASHGAPDHQRPGNLYIITWDTDLDRMAATAFPMWDFKTALRRQIGAERTLVIADACHSGGTLAAGDNPIAGAFTEIFSPSRRVMLTAADVEEYSLEGPEYGGHGVFTHELLRGLRGDADLDGDGVVTFSELATFVQQRVPALTGGRQNPQRVGLGDMPLGYVLQ